VSHGFHSFRRSRDRANLSRGHENALMKLTERAPHPQQASTMTKYVHVHVNLPSRQDNDEVPKLDTEACLLHISTSLNGRLRTPRSTF